MTDQLYQHDNNGLLNLLEGVCLRHLGKNQEAFTCFREIVDRLFLVLLLLYYIIKILVMVNRSFLAMVLIALAFTFLLF